MALEESADAYSLYRQSRLIPGVPAFTGGLLDAWPLALVEAFGIITQEEAAVSAWLKSEAANG